MNIKKDQHVKMIRISCMLKTLMHVHVHKHEKRSTCQNDQNFVHVKNIEACACANAKKFNMSKSLEFHAC